MTAYEQAGQTTVDRARFGWWLVLGTLRWGVICRYQAQRHLSGQSRSVELATIGRRVAETDPAGRGAPVTGEYGRPTAAELVAAVAEFLEADVRAATTGRVNFPTRVATNALRIIERELGAPSQKFADALAGLGFGDEAALAVAIRAGELDHPADDVSACLRTPVRHRLAVAHPGCDTE